MDRWSSFSRFGSRKLPTFHRCLQVWRQLTPARAQRAMPAPVWEGIAGQLTLLNQPHLAALILILLVTYIRPSELLALRTKDLVSPLATSPMLVGRDRSFQTGVRDGSVLMDQPWQWVNKLLLRLQVRDSGKKTEISCSIKIVQDCKQGFGTQRHDHVPHTSQWIQHRSGAGFRNFARSAINEVCGELSAVSQNTTIAADYHSLRPTPRNKLETLARRALPRNCWLGDCESSAYKRVSWQKRRIIWDCVSMCSTRSFDISMT